MGEDRPTKWPALITGAGLLAILVIAGYIVVPLVGPQPAENQQTPALEAQNRQPSPEDTQKLLDELTNPTWKIRSDDLDPIDDTPRLAYSLAGDFGSQVPGKKNPYSTEALVLRCLNRTTEVLVVAERSSESGVSWTLVPSPPSHMKTQVRVRLDQSRPTEEEWAVDHRRGLWASSAPIQLIDQLVSTRLLQFEYPTSEGKAIIRFHINLLGTERRDRLAKACNWPKVADR